MKPSSFADFKIYRRRDLEKYDENGFWREADPKQYKTVDHEAVARRRRIEDLRSQSRDDLDLEV